MERRPDDPGAQPDPEAGHDPTAGVPPPGDPAAAGQPPPAFAWQTPPGPPPGPPPSGAPASDESAPGPPTGAPPPPEGGPAYAWQAPAEAPGPAPGIEWASFGARLVAYILDGFIIGIIWIVAVLVALVPLLANPDSPGPAALLLVLVFIAGIVFSIVYFPWFWGHGGQTPGMKPFGIRVVRDRDGGPVTGGMAVLRYLGYIVNGIALYIGFIWALFDARKRGWHDLIAGTVVIKDR